MRLLFFCCVATLVQLLPVSVFAKLTNREKAMQQQGLIDIHSLDSTIKVSLMYARTDNFMGRVLYKDISHAYLHPKAAKALVEAQRLLKKSHPNLSLVVFDATRPMSIQQEMWNAVASTPQNIYVSNPARGGGMHNYGLAVDISICDEKGDTITMGCKIDYMGMLSHIDQEEAMQSSGKLSKEAVKNRKLLRKVMSDAGFVPLRTEWWHFNLVSRAVAKKYYKPIK